MLETGNYKIIQDLELLKKFIEWLPDLKEEETYYVSLLARNKYMKDLGLGTFNSDKHQCKRFTSNKSNLIYKIKQLETKLGTYICKDIVIPQGALALYMTVNPRSQVKASKLMLHRCADIITSNYLSFNLHQEAMSSIHKSIGTKHYIDIDFDHVDFVDIKDKVFSYINESAVTALQTRGGFHLLVEVSKIEPKYVKSWYKNIIDIPGVDIQGDNMIPIPGCVQGDFVPYFIDRGV